MLNDSPSISPRAGRFNLFIVLIVFLGLGLVIFAILSIYAFGMAHTATTTLDAQKAAAVAAATKKQIADDKTANLKANESPYRSYTAPIDYGGFVISFPKNWSGYDVENVNSATQVLLTLNPDFVHFTNSVADPAAAKITLMQTLTTTILNSYADRIKRGVLKSQAITVSGLPATDVTGSFDDKKTVRAVYIPVRDKTLIISTENAQYAAEFNEILAEAKINP